MTSTSIFLMKKDTSPEKKIIFANDVTKNLVVKNQVDEKIGSLEIDKGCVTLKKYDQNVAIDIKNGKIIHKDNDCTLWENDVTKWDYNDCFFILYLFPFKDAKTYLSEPDFYISEAPQEDITFYIDGQEVIFKSTPSQKNSYCPACKGDTSNNFSLPKGRFAVKDKSGETLFQFEVVDKPKINDYGELPAHSRSKLKAVFHRFLKDVLNNLQSLHHAIMLNSVEIKSSKLPLNECFKKNGFWELDTRLVFTSQGVKNGLIKESNEPALNNDDYFNKYRFDIVSQTIISRWLKNGCLTPKDKTNDKNKIGPYLVAHIKEPDIFPLRGGQVGHTKRAFEFLNSDWWKSDEKSYVQQYKSLKDEVEKLEKNVKFQKLIQNLISTNRWHPDYLTDLIVYIENPYIFGSELYLRLKTNPQVIYYGPPGTGKTHSAVLEADWLVSWELERMRQAGGITSEDDKWLKTDNYIKKCQLHPNYSYEDFIEGLRPITKEESKSLSYEIKEGPFKKFCRKAGAFERCIFELAHKEDPKEWETIIKKFHQENKGLKSIGYDIKQIDKEDAYLKLEGFKLGENRAKKKTSIELKWSTPSPKKRLKKYTEIIQSNGFELPPFIFIIDEINRAHLSTVLGELMYCLEYRGPEHILPLTYSNQLEIEDKDKQQDKEQVIAQEIEQKQEKLPKHYAWDTETKKDCFFVPNNVYIIGTMNTVDKSTESIDFALRRRFSWVKFKSKLNDNVLWSKLYRIFDDDTKKIISCVRSVYESLNERLKDDLNQHNQDFQIGETYFYKLDILFKYQDPGFWIQWCETNSYDDKAYLKWLHVTLETLYKYHLHPVLEDYYSGETYKWIEAENKFKEIFHCKEKTSFNKTPEKILNILKTNPQVILYGPPGTGKTHATGEVKKHFEGKAWNDRQWEFIQFHPSYSYEDFLQGIRPVVEKKDIVTYQLKWGKFKEFCYRASAFERLLFNLFYTKQFKEHLILFRKYDLKEDRQKEDFSPFTVENNDLKSKIIKKGKNAFLTIRYEENKIKVLKFKNSEQRGFDPNDEHDIKEAIEWILEDAYKEKDHYIMVIDEINRGDLASVFGELMYCLEYRGPEGYVDLAYSGSDEDPKYAMKDGNEVFFIPTNLWLIGAMNTIDRSTEPMDFALRRRFSWIKFNPSNKTEFENAIHKIIERKKMTDMKLEEKKKFPLWMCQLNDSKAHSIIEKDEEFKNYQNDLIQKEENKEGKDQKVIDKLHKAKRVSEIEQIHEVMEALNRKLKKDIIDQGIGKDYQIGETYFYHLIEILKHVHATCVDGNNNPIKSVFSEIHRGPVNYICVKKIGENKYKYIKNSAMSILFEEYLWPVLEDYYSMSGGEDQGRKEYLRDLMHGNGVEFIESEE